MNIKKAGAYKVKYTVSDKAKNKAVKTLKVKVIEKSKAQRIVSAAKSKLGSPYRYGSNGPKSFDCSGFTQWVYKQVGKKLPRSSSSQKRGGKLIKLWRRCLEKWTRWNLYRKWESDSFSS